jgi:hypothetical protein
MQLSVQPLGAVEIVLSLVENRRGSSYHQQAEKNCHVDKQIEILRLIALGHNRIGDGKRLGEATNSQKCTSARLCFCCPLNTRKFPIKQNSRKEA